MELLYQTVLILAVLTLILIFLITCPSRAGFWEGLEFFARIHKEANQLMDREKVKKKREMILGKEGDE